MTKGTFTGFRLRFWLSPKPVNPTPQLKRHMQRKVHELSFSVLPLDTIVLYEIIIVEMVTILVTGANRGIGYAIVQAIGTRFPSSTIILGCRNTDAAKDAIESLPEDGVKAQLSYVELDIENDASVEAVVTLIDRDYGKLDGMLLIN